MTSNAILFTFCALGVLYVAWRFIQYKGWSLVEPETHTKAWLVMITAGLIMDELLKLFRVGD